MMIYDFYILTNDGLKNSIIESDADFSCAPFGFARYRKPSSCECSPDIIDKFWNCVDLVLSENNLTGNDFIRAIRAISGDKVYGEYYTH